MSRLSLRCLQAVLLPAAMLLLAAPLSAQTVYKWKDANGVTQYSSTPPPSGGYETRQLDVRQGKPARSEEGPAEDPICAQVREDLALLRGDRPLRVDNDGDGEAEHTLDETERANRLQLAEATLRVQCSDGGDAAPPREEGGSVGVAE